MWHKKSLQRNYYLQKCIPDMNSDIIDENVAKAHEFVPRGCDLEADRLPEAKANLAYGLRGLTKLMEEICSKDSCVQFQALNTLSDILYDPLESQRALRNFAVVKKLNNILWKKLRKEDENIGKIRLILKMFGTLALHQDGAMELTSYCTLVQGLYDLILKDTQFAQKSSQILSLITAHSKVALKLVNSKYLEKLTCILKCVHSGWRLPDLLCHVSHLIPLNPGNFVTDGYFEMFFTKIAIKDEMQELSLKCLALLLNCKEGQEKLEYTDGITLLYQILLDEELPATSHEYVCLAMQNGTISKKVVWRCREFWDLPILLIRRAHDKTTPRMQLYALQTIRQITAMPSVKNFVRKVCKKQIIAIVCLADYVEKSKEKLLAWLRKKAYHNSDSAEPTLNSNCFGFFVDSESSDDCDDDTCSNLDEICFD